MFRGIATRCRSWLTPRSGSVRRPEETVSQAVSPMGSRLKEARRTSILDHSRIVAAPHNYF